MAITTYAELQSAIADWLARPGDATISAIAPDLIRLAEARINFGAGEPGDALHTPPLRVRQMETRSTATATSEYIALPTDFLEMREMRVDGSPERKLNPVTPQQFSEAAASHESGTPRVYTIEAGQFRLGPAPSGAGVTLELIYYAKVPALSASQTTNWLLSEFPNVYLFGSLLEAGPYIGDDAAATRWLTLFQGAMRGLQAADRRAKHGGMPLVMRPATRTP